MKAETRLYHLYVRKVRILPGKYPWSLGRQVDTDEYEQITSYPMSHEKCCILKSKFQPDRQARILFVAEENAPGMATSASPPLAYPTSANPTCSFDLT